VYSGIYDHLKTDIVIAEFFTNVSIPTVMMDLWTGEREELFYLIDEKKIMAILWREEDGLQY